MPETYVVKLSDGNKMPMVGYGTYKVDSYMNVKTAIECGYRHIDTASHYKNEWEVGRAINGKISEGYIARSDIFVTSKLWNTHHEEEKVVEGCRKSLKALNLDYLDLFLIHWPIAFKGDESIYGTDSSNKQLLTDTDFLETWKGMEKCYKMGLTRSIGLSNFNDEQIERIMNNCYVKPSVLQVECHPYLNQEKMLQFCKNNNIALVAYSPLGSPGKTDLPVSAPMLLQDERVVNIAFKHGKSPAQVVLKYQLQRGVSVIPKSSSRKRMVENLELFDFELSKEDMDVMNNLGKTYRYLPKSCWKNHRFYPFAAEC